VALQLLQYFYQENGYLKAKISNPVINEDETKRLIYITLKIEAGAQSRVASIAFSGNSHFSQEALLADLELKPGTIFSWPALSQARVNIINKYRGAGFKEITVEAGAEARKDTPDYEVNFTINEGQIYRISQIELTGLRRARPAFVSSAAGLKPGEPLSLERLAQAQKTSMTRLSSRQSISALNQKRKKLRRKGKGFSSGESLAEPDLWPSI